MTSNRAWVSSLDPDLNRQQTAIGVLLDLCESLPLVASLSVGCSLGRGAADSLSDVDAAIGVGDSHGRATTADLQAVEHAVIAVLPQLGTLVDVMRTRAPLNASTIFRIFGQWDDRLQLDLAVIAEDEVRRGDAAPDFVSVYWRGDPPAPRGRSAYRIDPDQVREWSFLGWRALLDADKYLQRTSLWEAHQRLNQARERIWMLWAAAHNASYPWHGLSQVMDEDPALLPPRIEATVAGLDPVALRAALVASIDVLDHCSALAARRRGGRVPSALSSYVRHTVTWSSDDVDDHE